MATEWQVRLGALIRQYREMAGLSQRALAPLISAKADRKVPQQQVGAHEQGLRWRDDLDLIGVYADVLGIPSAVLREVVRMPFMSADGEVRQPPTFAEIVQADTSLSKAAKDHILLQYELLQMASEHERRGEPILRQDKEAQREERA